MPPDDRPPSPASGAVRRVVGSVREFLATEAGGGAILLAATVAALAWVNSPWGDSYENVWRQSFTIGIGDASVTHDVRHWINEGLMTFFFLVVGLEIKRELVAGELDSMRKALLPVIAAAGGMALPALVYLAVNAGGPGAGGWAVPMATDIAFAAGALSLFGTVSASSRVFLLALAIVDDIGAIVLIALFYSGRLDGFALLAALVALAAIALLRRAKVSAAPVYVVLGVVVWIAVMGSGVHGTIAGVALGLMVPARPGNDSRSTTPVAERVVRRLHPWTSYAIVPLFALANAGVALSVDSVADAVTSRVGIGIVLGLVVGKLAGITGATWAAVKLRLRPPPEDGWATTAGVAALAGIGFTVSLFVADLAFTDEHLSEAKIGILVGSALASALGAMLLRLAAPRRDNGS